MILKRDALERLMAEENPEKAVEGKSSKKYFDVWLAINPKTPKPLYLPMI